MIDTIILRIHDIRKYSKLIQCLELYNSYGYTLETAKLPITELHQLRKEGGTDKQIVNIMKEKHAGNFLVKTEVGKQMNASNHYSFTYFINYTKDHIEFNFSVPKYKYGTNILMFVEHILDRDFQMYGCMQLEYNFNKSFQLLDSFLKDFLFHEFILCDINLKDIEINRIDVCFNQVFRSKEDALLYLDYQKKLRKKYARDEDGVMSDYSTSMMYKTKRYSAKIYHKGAEYEKNDLKEHIKINLKKGKQYFRTDYFQKFADRILRYELTIRNTYLNYLHKHNIFRNNCPFYKIAYNDFLKVENKMQRNDRISKKAGTLTKNDRESFLMANPYEKISRESRENYKYVQRLMTKRTYFMMDIDSESVLYNSKTVGFPCRTALFSKNLLKCCLNKLLDFINEFQITELPDEEKVKQSIERYNSTHRGQLPKIEMVHFYSELIQRGSFKEVRKLSIYSRATFFRYKQRFKKIGITETSIKPISEDIIPKAPIDLNAYHSYLLYDHDLLRGIKILCGK